MIPNSRFSPPLPLSQPKNHMDSLPSNGDLPEYSTDSSGSSCGANVWKMPLEPDVTPHHVMGASSWPALSNPSNKISTPQERSSKSLAELVAIPESAPLKELVNGTLGNPPSVSVEDPVNNLFSGKKPSLDCSENQRAAISGDNASQSSSSTTSSSVGPDSDHKNAGGVVPSRSGPPRPSRSFNHHRASHHQGPRYPQHQRGREPFNNYNSNNNHNNYANRRHQNRSHELNANRGFSQRPFHPPHPQQGYVNEPQHFLPPPPPPPLPLPLPPYPHSMTFPYNNTVLPANPGYMFPYPRYGQPPYFPDVSSSWQFTLPPYTDTMRGVSPVNHLPQPPQSHLQTPVAPQDSDLCQKLLTQIEYYFSDENLTTDTYLKGKMDGQGWVSIHLIAGFRRVRAMTEDISLILKALRPSKLIEIQGDKIRRHSSGIARTSPVGAVGPMLPAQTVLITEMVSLRLDGGSGGESRVVGKAEPTDILSTVTIGASNEHN